MRWPFRTEQDTDLRMYRDPKTNEPTLKLQGGLKIGIVAINITLRSPLTRAAALRLRDQINVIFGADDSAVEG